MTNFNFNKGVSSGNFMVVNGKSINIPSGSSISVMNGEVFVDGKAMPMEGLEDTKTFNITIQGSVDSVDGNFASVTVEGDAGSVKTMSGDIRVKGSVKGSVSTMSGDIDVKGGVSGSASSMSGNVSR